jgi:hypothetical protein
MAFTTTADLKLTAADIVTEALELLGVLAEGDTPSAAQYTSSLRTLNNLIKMWQADTQIFAQGEYTLDLVASQAQYTLDVSSVGYIPMSIQNAVLYHSTDFNEIPLRPLTQEEYYSLTDKTTESRPTQYFFKRNPVEVAATIDFWPVPEDTTYDVKLWIQYPYRDIDASVDDVWFTQEWYMALSWMLAALLSPKYGIHIQERDQLMKTAEDFYFTASTWDKDGSMFLQPEDRRNG